jgi:hypothetical protein
VPGAALHARQSGKLGNASWDAPPVSPIRAMDLHALESQPITSPSTGPNGE